MAFIRRQASSKRGRGVVLWDDWAAPEPEIDQPQAPQRGVDTARQHESQRQTVAHTSSPARARFKGNNRAHSAKAAHVAMVRNFAVPTKSRKTIRGK